MRELAAEYQVTRHVVREALKRLEAIGLVRIRQGSGIFVEGVKFSGGVELFEVMLTAADGSLNAKFLRDVLEFRSMMVRQIVRLAARRRTETQMTAIRALAVQRARLDSDDPQRLAINQKLYRLIAEASHNQIYEGIFNTVGRLTLHLEMLIDLAILGTRQQQSFLFRLTDAIEAKDEAAADSLMRESAETIAKTLHVVLEGNGKAG